MKTILVALDDSPRAPEVLAAATELGVRTGAHLLLLRAVGLPSGLPPEALAVSPDRLPALLEREGLRSLEALAQKVPGEILDGLQVQMGTAWQAICRVAQEADVDLVVIGSHGYGGLDRLLGTTAGRVVHHADQSVLVVRPRPAA